MAGVATGGQTLTPPKNVTARAGFGGDIWGANGGAATPIGNGNVGMPDGRVAWAQPLEASLSNGETDGQTLTNPGPGNRPDQRRLDPEASRAALPVGYATGNLPGLRIPGVMLPGVQT